MTLTGRGDSLPHTFFGSECRACTFIGGWDPRSRTTRPDRLFEDSVEAAPEMTYLLHMTRRRKRETWVSKCLLVEDVPLAVIRIEPREFLTEAVRSSDGQQAFLASGVAGFIGAEQLAKEAAGVLGEHLAMNTSVGDARFACAAAQWDLASGPGGSWSLC